MPDALNYRVGPHPGCPWVADGLIYREGPQSGGPLYVPDPLNNGEEPQAREPSKCLNEQSKRKTGQRSHLIASYKRLEKRL